MTVSVKETEPVEISETGCNVDLLIDGGDVIAAGKLNLGKCKNVYMEVNE